MATPPYHHRANLTERCNRTLKLMIAMYLQGNHKECDVHVHEFRSVINTAVHGSTKFSSALLNFRRHPLPPSSLRREVEQGREIEATMVEEWREKMRRMENVRDLVRKHNEHAQERQVKTFDQGNQKKTYKVGEEVIRKVYYLSSVEKGVRAKLFEKFDEGPYKIAEVLSSTIYLLDLENKSQRLPMFHSNQLKLYVPRGPRWKAPEATARHRLGNWSNYRPRLRTIGSCVRRHGGRQPGEGRTDKVCRERMCSCMRKCSS